MKHLTIIYSPCLTHAEVNPSQAESVQASKETANLNKLMTRGKTYVNSAKNYEALLFHLFGYELNVLPVAAVTALGDGLTVGSDYWLFADPVELKADMTSLYLIGKEHLKLSSAEQQQLLKDLNVFLEKNDKHFYLGKNHWYLSQASDPQLVTYDLKQAIGRNLREYPLQGQSARQWQAWLTEWQMMLHHHSVNEQRSVKGLPAINSLWLWGGGTLPPAKPNPWQMIWTKDSLCVGLAKLTSSNHKYLSNHFDECLTQIQDEGNYLICIEDQDQQNADGVSDLAGLSLATLDELWLTPALNALSQNQIDSITLYWNQAVYEINKKNLKPWWQRLIKF